MTRSVGNYFEMLQIFVNYFELLQISVNLYEMLQISENHFEVLFAEKTFRSGNEISLRRI